jgi:hypothetical protein
LFSNCNFAIDSHPVVLKGAVDWECPPEGRLYQAAAHRSGFFMLVDIRVIRSTPLYFRCINSGTVHPTKPKGSYRILQRRAPAS